MRTALISDIHSNVEALYAVLEDISSQSVDAICVLGDIVGYGADPSLCTKIIMALFDRSIESIEGEVNTYGLSGLGMAIVRGNHDEAVAGGDIVRVFNPKARAACEWSANQLSDEEMAFIKELPYAESYYGALLVHATPKKPETFEYIMQAVNARIAIQSCPDNRLIFFGHTHKPTAYRLKEKTKNVEIVEFNNEIKLEKDYRYLINIGSVGQPRDRDVRAAYAIWDSNDGSVVLRRVEYDVEKAAKKITDAGLPPELGQRLTEGR